MVGQTIAHYRVVEKLGAGGMGEVYRARDERLGRDVALKVVRSEFTQSPDRLARFQREAHLLASLNHPHIAAIHGLEEADGLRFLVLELVEGETLAERLARGPLPLEEALPLARQMAEALEYAHEKGIIHRDLKPANVKITPDGTAKLLDFGLAKALETPPTASDLGDSPTISDVASRTGVLLGTAAYMSPEQARAKPADRRADIWAFGGVLFEMLTARRPFEGETVYDLISAILSREPDWSTLPAATPPALRKLLRRCLHKDPKMRLQAIGEARIALDEALQPSSAETPAAAAPLPRRVLLLWGLTLIGALGLGIVFGRLGRGESTAPGGAPVRAVVPLPEGTRLAGWAWPVVAISPDGQKIAFVATRGASQRLYVRHLARPEAEEVPDSDGAEGPFFSPDSQWVAFAMGNVSGRSTKPGELRKVSVEGGLSQRICGISDYFGGDWSEDGTIVFVDRHPEGLWRVPAAGGRPQPLGPASDGAEASIALFWPQIVRGTRWILATRLPGVQLVAIDRTTGELKEIGLYSRFARYAPTGHLVFADQEGSLLAVSFDSQKAEVRGAPVKLLEGITVGGPGAAAAVFALSGDGSLLYSTGYLKDSFHELTRFAWLGLDGTSRSLPIEPDTFKALSLSPDGKRLATMRSSDPSVSVFDLERQTFLRLPRGHPFAAGAPVWSPDGQGIVFTASSRDGLKLFWQLADGSAPPEQLTHEPGEQWATSWSPDGRSLLYQAFGPGRKNWDILLLPLDANRSPGQPRLLLGTPAREQAAQFSPDGRWLAFSSDESGRGEIYVQRLPDLGGKTVISTRGGRQPRWSPDGRRLYYWQDEGSEWQLMAVSITPGAQLQVGSPVALLRLEKGSVVGLLFDIAPTGRDFLLLSEVPGSGIQTELQLVLNWFEELRRLVPNK